MTFTTRSCTSFEKNSSTNVTRAPFHLAPLIPWSAPLSAMHLPTAMMVALLLFVVGCISFLQLRQTATRRGPVASWNAI